VSVHQLQKLSAIAITVFAKFHYFDALFFSHWRESGVAVSHRQKNSFDETEQTNAISRFS